MFKNATHSNISLFKISQDYYELPKRMIKANDKTYHKYKPYNFRDVQKLYQDKASMYRTLNENELLTSTCWNETYRTLTIDMTKGKKVGSYRLGIFSVFVPDIYNSFLKYLNESLL